MDFLEEWVFKNFFKFFNKIKDTSYTIILFRYKLLIVNVLQMRLLRGNSALILSLF